MTLHAKQGFWLRKYTYEASTLQFIKYKESAVVMIEVSDFQKSLKQIQQIRAHFFSSYLIICTSLNNDCFRASYKGKLRTLGFIDIHWSVEKCTEIINEHLAYIRRHLSVQKQYLQDKENN